jgi:hypothetical protein
MMDSFCFPRFDREDFMTFDQGAIHSRCYNRSPRTVNGFARTWLRSGQASGKSDTYLQQNGERILGFVRLLIAGANQIFHSYGGFHPLALFKFRDPIADGIDDVTGSLANGLRLVALAINALGAFDYFYFFLGHKHKGEQFCNQNKRNIWLKVPAWIRAVLRESNS